MLSTAFVLPLLIKRVSCRFAEVISRSDCSATASSKGALLEHSSRSPKTISLPSPNPTMRPAATAEGDCGGSASDRGGAAGAVRKGMSP